MGKGSRCYCQPCTLEYQREYRAANKERLKEYWRLKNLRDRENPAWTTKERKRGRDYWQKVRHEAIMAYGGYICACCGETEPRFLTLDHMNNDGANHRRSLGWTISNGRGCGGAMLNHLRHTGYPPGYQILCMNCNFGKAHNGGVCPHITAHANRVNSGEAQTG